MSFGPYDVAFSALMLLVWQQEWYLASKRYCQRPQQFAEVFGDRSNQENGPSEQKQCVAMIHRCTFNILNLQPEIHFT